MEEPDCNCYSSVTTDRGDTVHYKECALIQHYLEMM